MVTQGILKCYIVIPQCDGGDGEDHCQESENISPMFLEPAYQWANVSMVTTLVNVVY